MSEISPALLVQPPLIFEGVDVIYPSLPCIGAALRENGIQSDYINTNLLYQRYEKERCLIACRELTKATFNGSDEDDEVSSRGISEYSYWSKFLCEMLVELGPRVAVNPNASVRIDEIHSLDAFFSHVWDNFAGGLFPHVEINPCKEQIGDIVGGESFADFIKTQMPSWNLSHRRIVGITVPMVDNLGFALILAKLIKEFEPGVIVVLGGTAFSAVFSWIVTKLRDLSYVDFIVEGAGELPIVAIANNTSIPVTDVVPLKSSMAEQEALSRRPQLRGSLTTTPAVEYPLPATAFELTGEVTFVQSRGCYWGECTYCTYPELYGPNDYRERPVELLADEITAHVGMGYSRFRLANDTLREGYAMDLSRLIIDRGLNVQWRSFMRAEPFKNDTLSLMKLSGGHGFIIGLETVVDRLLRFVKKGVQRKTVEQLFRNMRRIGLKVEVNAIPDLPTTTVNEARETLSFLEEFQDIICRLNISSLVIPARSPMAKNPAANGIRLLEQPPRNITESTLLAFERFAGATTLELQEIKREYVDLSSRIAACERQRCTSQSSGTNSSKLDFSRPAPKFALSSSQAGGKIREITYNVATQEFRSTKCRARGNNSKKVIRQQYADHH